MDLGIPVFNGLGFLRRAQSQAAIHRLMCFVMFFHQKALMIAACVRVKSVWPAMGRPWCRYRVNARSDRGTTRGVWDMSAAIVCCKCGGGVYSLLPVIVGF